jgi:hypothetical protein
VKGIDHLVLCGRDLEAMRERYGDLGFTLTSPAQHPFGTGNSLVQFDGCFLELLSVLDEAIVPEHAPGHFSFAAFNRDFLLTNEGFSMLVLDSNDARADVSRLRSAGIDTYKPFDFSRKALLPSGEEVTVGFSLAFATHPEMPRAGFFSCQQHAPQHFWKPEYQRHANTAVSILEVCLIAEHPKRFESFVSQLAGARPERINGGSRISTTRGDIAILSPDAFADRYGTAPPSLADGPRFAGFTIGLVDTRYIEEIEVPRVMERWVVPPNQTFGTVIAFVRMKSQEPAHE